jgi:hypothetical protein
MYPFHIVAKCLEHSPWEISCCSAGQEILHHSSNVKGSLRVYKGLTLDRVLKPINKVHALTPSTECVGRPAVDVDCCAKFPSCYGTRKILLFLQKPVTEPVLSRMNPVHIVMAVYSRTFCGADKGIPCLGGGTWSLSVVLTSPIQTTRSVFDTPPLHAETPLFRLGNRRF